MLKYAEVKKISEEMLENLAEMEDLAVKFKPKTDNYDKNIGDDISASAKDLMDSITKTIKVLKGAVSEKTKGVRNFTTKIGESEKKNVRRIGSING